MVWLTAANTGIVMGLIMACCVLGLAIAYRLFNFADLTIEGSFLVGAVGMAIAQRAGFSVLTSFLAAMLLGVLAGMLTAFLHAKFRVNKFLAGIIVCAICYTLGLRLMGSSNIGLLSSTSFLDILDTSATVGGISLGKISVLLAFIVGLCGLLYAGLKSRIGLRLRVAGCNTSYAKTLNINVILSLVIVLGITNGLAAFSGALLALHQGFADIGLGQGVLIFALASMSVGERVISENKLPLVPYILASAVMGSVIYQLLMAFAIRAGLNPVDLKLVTAIFVLALIVLRVRKVDDASLQ